MQRSSSASLPLDVLHGPSVASGLPLGSASTIPRDSYAIGNPTRMLTASAVQPAGAVNVNQSPLSPGARHPVSENSFDTQASAPIGVPMAGRSSGSCSSLGRHANGVTVDASTQRLSEPLHAWPSGHDCSGPHRYVPERMSGLHAATSARTI